MGVVRERERSLLVGVVRDRESEVCYQVQLERERERVSGCSPLSAAMSCPNCKWKRG